MSLSQILDSFSQFNKEKPKQIDNVIKVSTSHKTNLNLTQEQEAILNAKEDIIKVTAYAGSGKTFVLENFAKKNIKKRGLYIAFNKDLKMEAEKRFPESVKCMTMHGLAFSRFGKDLAHKLNIPFYPQHVFDVPNIQKQPDVISEIYARCIYNTVINFTYSKDPSIQKHHLFLDELNILIKSLKETGNENNLEIIKNIKINNLIQDAELLWSNMIDPNSSIGTTHDSYLKLMQLAKVQLPYETILLDEAQDVNPAMLDLFERQRSRKLLTGDPYQSIYQFRKAVDAMTLSYADKNYFLTKSFRFGQEVADIANTIISLRGESKPLFGLENVESKIESLEEFENKLFQKLSQYKTKAVITRTNAKMFEEAVKYSAMGFKVYFEGGEQMARFDLLEDLANMKKNRMPQDGFLKNYFLNYNKNGELAFEALKEFTKENAITDWYLRCVLVEKYKDNLNLTISQLKNNIVLEKEENVIIITNVHKSKGLEYEAVILSDDFNIEFMLLNIKNDLSNKKKLGLVKEKDYENVNLIYVAMTRAKFLLLVNEETLYHSNNLNMFLRNKLLYNPSNLNLIVGNNYNFNLNVKPYSTEEYLDVLLKMKTNLMERL